MQVLDLNNLKRNLKKQILFFLYLQNHSKVLILQSLFTLKATEVK